MFFKTKEILKKLDIILKYAVQDPIRILKAQTYLHRELLAIKELLQDIKGELYKQNLRKKK